MTEVVLDDAAQPLGAGEAAVRQRLLGAGAARQGEDAVKRFMNTPEMVPYQKQIVSDSRAKVMEHWTARLAVHVWDRLELSEEKMETLRHLLSFVYDPETDKYVPIKIWENPNDASD